MPPASMIGRPACFSRARIAANGDRRKPAAARLHKGAVVLMLREPAAFYGRRRPRKTRIRSRMSWRPPRR
jgi:hypothetical protein